MTKDRRFFVGLTGVTAVVTYLIWTGVSQTMVYYLTPSELLARVAADAAFYEVGVKVSGQVVPGSHQETMNGNLLHRFLVHDLDDPSVRIPVEFRSTLPDTFTEEVEVVLGGRYRADGVFEATEVLTKCGSRYEAMPEYEGGGDYDAPPNSGTAPEASRGGPEGAIG